jgi:hypothetical protein
MTNLASATGPLYYDQSLESATGGRWRVVAFPNAWGQVALALTNNPIVTASASRVSDPSDYLLYRGPYKGEALRAARRSVANQRALGFRRVAGRRIQSP